MVGGEIDLPGSVAALVRETGQQNGAVYLLGCHHVFFRSLVTPNASADATARLRSEGQNDQVLGPATRAAPFGPGLRSIDAALVELRASAMATVTGGGFWRRVATGIVRDDHHVAVVSQVTWELQSRYDPMPLDYVRTIFDQEIPYGSNHIPIRIAEVVVATSLGRVPMGGDSGGAVMAGPILVGLHIASDGPLSYSIPAHLLFSAQAFTPKIELASDLIDAK